jgi:hypothetical protein
MRKSAFRSGNWKAAPKLHFLMQPVCCRKAMNYQGAQEICGFPLARAAAFQ